MSQEKSNKFSFIVLGIVIGFIIGILVVRNTKIKSKTITKIDTVFFNDSSAIKFAETPQKLKLEKNFKRILNNLQKESKTLQNKYDNFISSQDSMPSYETMIKLESYDKKMNNLLITIEHYQQMIKAILFLYTNGISHKKIRTIQEDINAKIDEAQKKGDKIISDMQNIIKQQH